MKYIAEVVSHITVDAQTREQAEFRVNNILGKMQSLFEDGEVVFRTNSINQKHYRHMPHYFQSPNHGNLRHQHINVSRLKPGSTFAYWNKKTDMLYLYEKLFAGTWAVEKWDKRGMSAIVSKTSGLDDATVLQRIDASNNHEPDAEGYVIGMEHISSRQEILKLHSSSNVLLIGYNTKRTVDSCK